MLYAGVIAAEIWNANPFRKEGSPPVSPLDFVPKSRTEIAAAQSLDEQIRILTIAMGCGPEL